VAAFSTGQKAGVDKIGGSVENRQPDKRQCVTVSGNLSAERFSTKMTPYSTLSLGRKTTKVPRFTCRCMLRRLSVDIKENEDTSGTAHHSRTAFGCLPSEPSHTHFAATIHACSGIIAGNFSLPIVHCYVDAHISLVKGNG
jgi:hypothetical protein